MKEKNKKLLHVLFLSGCALAGYLFWLGLRPVEIIAVHRSDNHSYVLVKNFPFSDKGKINWWLINNSELKKTYNIPTPDNDGFFTVVFWDFGEGYKEEGKYDRFCFEDMQPPKNCIEKDKVFTISHSRNMGISYTTNNAIYRTKKNGEIIKDENND